MSKRMRLPNGFGQISEIKGRRLRKPFRAMVTVGKSETGRPIVRPLKPESFFKTYNDAYAALIEYNKNPYDLDDSMTVGELYKKWTEDYFSKIKSTSTRTITSSWAYCSSVEKMRAKDLRARHIKACMESADTPNKQSRIKSLFNIMLDYALEYEIVDRNYARTFALSDDLVKAKEKATKSHLAFSEEEIKTLWDNLDKVQYVNIILFQIYSGWRPQELGLIKAEDVDLDNWFMKGGMKTEAGENRIVPIHPAIRDITKKLKELSILLGSEYLINTTDVNRSTSNNFMSYDKYQKRFIKIRTQLALNPDHRAHDGRKTFVSLCKKYKVDEYAIKYMVGHKIEDLTERVYTDRELSWLQEEICKIPV